MSSTQIDDGTVGSEAAKETGVQVAENMLARNLFVPLALIFAAMLFWFAFQAIQFVRERSALATGFEQQEKVIQEANKLRQSLDAIAAATQKLADAGNANAQLLVDELRKRGVTINPAAAVEQGKK
jgi:hypothetical protein